MNPRRQPRPFTKFWFWPYGPSDTVAALAWDLKGKVIKREGSKYRRKKGHTIINWGNSHPAPAGIDLNQPAAVATAVSKMRTFRALEAAGVPTVTWTQDQTVAQQWAVEEKVVGRDIDNGRTAAGITLYRKGSQIGKHLFYSRYFRKQRELRVHVFCGRVIFEQEKLREKSTDDHDPYIRAHGRGWNFAFKHLAERPIPEEVRQAALGAVKALGLDFGGVDLGWNDGRVVVFEVNTAPGLENSTLQAYVNAIEELNNVVKD